MFGLILHDVHFLLHYHLTFLALISLLLIECFSQRVWGRKSLHMNLPCRSMWQKGGCIVSIRNWRVNGIPHWEQELQSLLLTLKFLLWPAACCWHSGTSPDILYAHPVKKMFHCAHPVKKKVSLQNENGLCRWGISFLWTLSGKGREEEIVAQSCNFKIIFLTANPIKIDNQKNPILWGWMEGGRRKAGSWVACVGVIRAGKRWQLRLFEEDSDEKKSST